MIIQALFVSIVMYILKITDIAWHFKLERPIVAGALVGLVLGHPLEGVAIAASIELVFLGSIMIGGSLPQDYTVGAVFGTAYAILLGKGSEIAITLAIPISMLAVFINQVILMVISAIVPKFDELIEKGEDKKFSNGMLACFFLVPLPYAIVTFLGIAFGTTGIETVVNAIPQVIMKGLSIAAGILPALGLAMLLKMLWTKHIAIFFFVGFAIVAYLKLPIIAVAIFAAGIAIHVCFSNFELRNKFKNMKLSDTNSTDTVLEEEEFFNA